MRNFFFTISILLFSTSFLQSQVRIKMNEVNGIYTTPCSVNGLSLSFIFDTGASNVSLSLSEAIFMLKNGYLDESDLHGSSFSQIANGDLIENTTVTLKLLEIGGIKLYNVEAIIIHELSAPLLLGQTAIQKLGRIQLEGDELIILDENSTSSYNSCIEAKMLVEKAIKYYFDKLNNLSSSTFQDAYDLCPEVLDCWHLELMGSAYELSYKFQSAIVYLEKAANCAENDKLYWIFIGLANSYIGLENFEIATLNLEKALSYAFEDNMKSHCYHDLGWINSKKDNYNQAIIYYEKSIEFYLKSNSILQNDVLKGNVNNDVLGEKYWNISNNYYKLNLHTKSNYYMIISALCGYDQAMEYCNKYRLDYKSIKQKKR